MADRFYCPEPAQNGCYVIEGEEARHLLRVLRLGPGDRVEIFDGEGRITPVEIKEGSRDRAVLEAVGDTREEPAASRPIILATAIPKGDRFDWLIEKTTELGVTTLIPLTTERSVVDPRASKLDRMRKRIIEAAKQCGRSRLMELAPPSTWPALLASPFVRLACVSHPGGCAFPDWPSIEPGGPLLMAVGPEGGFTDQEIELSTEKGWPTVSLGSTILRVETAGLVAATLAMAHAGLAGKRSSS